MLHKLTRTLALTLLMGLSALSALAADPGVDLPNGGNLFLNSQPSDQKKGSILFYNLYSSSAANANAQNTRISLTNTNQLYSIGVHLFFVDGTSCTVADSYICLTPNQTASFLASDVDPGTTGYIMAVATNNAGVPAGFDFLIGDEYVKLTSGHYANLGAVAINWVGFTPSRGLSTDGSRALLVFDGNYYSRLPRVLADSSVLSPTDGNNKLLVVNRVGGDLGVGAGAVGTVFGILYDDAESAFSFSFAGGVCQSVNTLSDSFPRVVPRLSSTIPTGRTGWLKLWSGSVVDNSAITTGFPFTGGVPVVGSTTDTRAILGAAINFNNGAGAGAFSGGHNLHELTLNPISFVTIPVFPPGCDVSVLPNNGNNSTNRGADSDR